MSKAILTAGIAITAVLLGAYVCTFAQHNPRPQVCMRAFDEYGAIGGCDEGARLDNYAIQLLNEPGTRGYIVVYAPESASKSIRSRITDYLVNRRGIPAKRLKTVYGGFNWDLTEPRIRLWILPKGAEEFEVEKREVDLEAVNGMLVEYPTSDTVAMEPVSVDEEEDPGTGPSVNVTYAAVDEILKAQKHAVVHVVGFNASYAVPGAWKRVAEGTAADLKRLGLESDRVEIGYGGQAENTKIQLWILPKGETPPVKDPASEPAPATAAAVGDFTDYELGNAKNELAAFNRLLAVLRANPDLRACLIVRSETSVPEEEAAGEEAVVAKSDEPVEQSGPTQPEPEPADLLKLVEKWKNELAVKYKIGPDRVVVLYSTAEQYVSSYLHVSVVPPGQPLPNADPEPEPAEQKPSIVVKDAQRRP